MAEKIFRKPKAVLIFNRRKTLALMAASVNEAAKISGLKPGNISKACVGTLISNGMYCKKWKYNKNNRTYESKSL